MINRESLHVFVSHTRSHQNQAAQIATGLEQFEVDAFSANRDIEDLGKWPRQLESELFSMDAFVALVSPDFEQSHWPNQEVGVAFGRQVPILPIDFGAIPGGFMSSINAIPSEGSMVQIAERIFISLLCKTPDTAVEGKAADCLISAIRSANGYSTAGYLASMLQHVAQLTNTQAQSLVDAYDRNDQVRKSHNFWKYGNEAFGRLTGSTIKEP